MMWGCLPVALAAATRRRARRRSIAAGDVLADEPRDDEPAEMPAENALAHTCADPVPMRRDDELSTDEPIEVPAEHALAPASRAEPTPMRRDDELSADAPAEMPAEHALTRTCAEPAPMRRDELSPPTGADRRAADATPNVVPSGARTATGVESNPAPAASEPVPPDSTRKQSPGGDAP